MSGTYPKGSISVEVYYKGNLMDETFFKDCPELVPIYPSIEQINNLRHQVDMHKKAGVTYTIVVTEFTVNVVEKPI